MTVSDANSDALQVVRVRLRRSWGNLERCALEAQASERRSLTLRRDVGESHDAAAASAFQQRAGHPLFPLVPGVEIVQRNALNAFDTEEVDVALWNARHAEGFYFLPNLLLVESKNWSHPCGSQEVAYFVSRLRQRGCDHGILVAANGITGVAADLTRSHFEMATALADGIRVLVITPAEIEALGTTSDLVTLMKKKLCQLVVSGTNFV